MRGAAAAAVVLVCLLLAGSIAGGTQARLDVAVPSVVVSEQPFDLQVRTAEVLRDLGADVDAGGPGAVVELLALRDGQWLSVLARPVLGPEVVLPARVWREDSLMVRLSYRDWAVDSDQLSLRALPAGPVVSAVREEPPVRYPSAPSAKGEGANAVVSEIPPQVWESMKGVSWQPGCPVGRAGLRMVEVNYWGFDGYRYRGRMVVAERVADRVAHALSDLYGMGFPIRQMRLPDSFGRGSVPLGATDYASMGADNSSGFNCRYVVGRESQKRLSMHAYGLAVDINPWENPFRSARGVVPSLAWAGSRPEAPGLLRTPGDLAVRAFTDRGAVWGGEWESFDYQHFEWPR